MLLRATAIVPVLLCGLLAAPAPCAAEAPDLHAYWDQRCQPCHGHAGDFARRTLHVVDGRLVGRHHTDDIESFLRQHYLADVYVAPVTAMLMAQVATPPVFEAHCRGCHGNAAAFARESLALRDGVLVGRAGGRPVSEFLRRHGGLPPENVAPLVATLTRVLGEVTPARP
jgi:hypothetical protein